MSSLQPEFATYGFADVLFALVYLIAPIVFLYYMYHSRKGENNVVVQPSPEPPSCGIEDSPSFITEQES